MFDPKNVNARLESLEKILLGYHRPIYVNDEKPSKENPTPTIVQEETGKKNRDGSPEMRDVLEYVPGVVNNVEALLSYQKGVLPAGEGGATNIDALLDAINGEKPAKKAKR